MSARYTAEELRAAYMLDLETEIRCAERDGQAEYAERCRAELAALRDAEERQRDVTAEVAGTCSGSRLSR